MMTARFVFLIFAGVVWPSGASYADKSQALREPEHSGLVKPAKATIRRPLFTVPRPSAAVRKPHQAAGESARSRPVHSPSPIRAVAAPLSKLRHRSPNPPVVTGSANLSRNTGVLDGTQVHRRL
jgi:hypothetical protein